MTRRRKYDWKQIAELYKQGKNLREIAAIVGAKAPTAEKGSAGVQYIGRTPCPRRRRKPAGESVVSLDVAHRQPAPEA